MQLYGSFEERGYKFEAYIPTDDSEPVAFELRIFLGEELKHSLLISMGYTPVFGVDSGDVAKLEWTVDQILHLLPPPDQFGPQTITALESVEVEAGGKIAREEQCRRKDRPEKDIGRFEYTGDLFASTFVSLFDSRAALDQWMRTKLPQLGDRTPAEALRLGMAPEVLKCIGQLAQENEQGDASK